MTGRSAALAFVAGAFVLRLGFGLCYEFWADDELQIFLIGLRHYATGEWPYFGPDVVYSQTRIPGALVGLLVATPLRLLAIPEAPYVLLNLLSAVTLALLAWYIGRRSPGVPRWFLWSWVFFCPWTLNFSTHVVNPSYVLTGAIVFFVGAIELLPRTSIGVVSERWAFAAMGFGLMWVYQLHLSFPLMVPFVLIACAAAAARGWPVLARGVGWFTIGAALPALLVLPTLWRFGFSSAFSTAGANTVIDFSNLVRIPEIVARFLSFASFELPRFLGNNTDSRLEFLQRQLWVAPFAVFGGIVGLLQPFVLLSGFFRREASAQRQWMTWATLLTLALICASFLFSVKDPASHAFYVIFPIANVYAFQIWERWFERRWAHRLAMALVISTIAVHIAIALDHRAQRSLYRDRALVVRAIAEKNYRLLGERRPVLWGQER